MAEARSVVPLLTNGQFDEIDTDGDVLIDRDELDAVINPNTGCMGSAKFHGMGALKNYVSDLFLLGVIVLTLAGMSRLRRDSTR